jgi:hypothetical protein
MGKNRQIYTRRWIADNVIRKLMENPAEIDQLRAVYYSNRFMNAVDFEKNAIEKVQSFKIDHSLSKYENILRILTTFVCYDEKEEEVGSYHFCDERKGTLCECLLIDKLEDVLAAASWVSTHWHEFALGGDCRWLGALICTLNLMKENMWNEYSESVLCLSLMAEDLYYYCALYIPEDVHKEDMVSFRFTFPDDFKKSFDYTEREKALKEALKGRENAPAPKSLNSFFTNMENDINELENDDQIELAYMIKSFLSKKLKV